MKTDSIKRVPLQAITSITLLEAVRALNGKYTWPTGIINSILTSLGWISSRVELHWQLRRSKSNRYYLQLGVKVYNSTTSMVLYPTPVSFNGRCGNGRKLSIIQGKSYNLSQKGTYYSITLRQLVENGLLPTPLARLAKVKCDVDRRKGNLQDAISRMVPPDMVSPQINPEFISEMMGFPARWILAPFT